MYGVYNGLDVEDFVFGEGTTYDEYNYDYDDYGISDRELNEFGVIECVEEPEIGCYKIALENEQNYNNIMNALMVSEINMLESGYYTEAFEDVKAKLRRTADKVKEAIKKWWAKAKGIFKKLTDRISTMVLSNKQFAKKYRGLKSKLKTPNGKKKFTGYNFPENGKISFSAVVDTIKSESGDAVKTKLKPASTSKTPVKDANDLASLKQTAFNKIRGCLVGKKNIEVDAGSFTTQLKTHLYGNNGNTSEISLAEFDTVLNAIENASDEKKSTKYAYSEAEKTVKGLIKETDEAVKNTDDENEEALCKFRIDLCNGSLTIMSMALSENIRAITAKMTQNRRMANYWITSQKTGYSESASVLDYVDII